MYLHQGKQQLIEGTVTSVPANEACLVLKTQVTLPPRTIGIVPLKTTESKLVQSNQHYQSEPDPHFQTQYPDVAAIPLLHQTTGKNQDELVTCLVNPSELEVVLPKNKTVQHIFSVSGKVQVNRIKLEQNDETIPSEKTEPFSKEVSTGMVMPADYSPHQKLELEDYEINSATKTKLQNLFEQFDSIVSRHTNDINTTPLLKMEIQTEGPPIASHPYVLPLKHHSFVCNEIENLEKAGVIRKSLSPYASPIMVVPKKEKFKPLCKPYHGCTKEGTSRFT